MNSFGLKRNGVNTFGLGRWGFGVVASTWREIAHFILHIKHTILYNFER